MNSNYFWKTICVTLAMNFVLVSNVTAQANEKTGIDIRFHAQIISPQKGVRGGLIIQTDIIEAINKSVDEMHRSFPKAVFDAIAFSTESEIVIVTFLQLNSTVADDGYSVLLRKSDLAFIRIKREIEE